MAAKQLVEFASNLRLDVDGSKHALLVAVEGIVSAELARLRAEAEALRADAEHKRGLLLWALYHAQGGSSPVGQPIRRHLGIGQHAHLTPEQIVDASRAAQGEN